MESRSKTLKIVLMGPGAVGKTSIRERYLGKGFRTSHNMTIGADFAIKKIPRDERHYIAQIWDLSGQPHFYEVRKLYYRGVDGLFFVFDLSNLTTLEKIPDWINEYRENVTDRNLPAVLIGNKLDLIELNIDQLRNEISSVANNLGISSFFSNEIIFTSALTGENIDTAFDKLIDQIMKSKTRVD